jgi:hypothetical protein
MRDQVPTISPVTRWNCPLCHASDVTTVVGFHQQFHTCPKLGFLSVPFVREGTKAKVEARLREDYIGGEVVRLNAEGRPVMSIVTTRDEGQDCTVYAPTATAKIE